MRLPPKVLKWVLRFYPPFFFQRIWIRKVHPNFQQLDIKITKSFLNINANKTVFGGTMFAAVDPIHTLLLDQLLKRNGITNTVTWLKSAQIEYLKPARRSLFFSIVLSDTDVRETILKVSQQGKIVKTFTIEIRDKSGQLCARSLNEIYIRDLTFEYKKVNFESNKY